MQRVLNLATEGTDNPDLRDRGFIYWRLLSHNPQVARAVVLGEKPTIADDTFALEPALLDQLVYQIATLASIYHKPPEAFVVRTAVPVGQATSPRDDEDYDMDYLDGSGDAGDGVGSPTTAAPSRSPPPKTEVDLLDLGMDSPLDTPAPVSAPAPAPVSGGLDFDLLGGGGPPAPTSAPVAKPVICTPQQSQGIEIRGILSNRGGQVVAELDFRNLAPTPITQLAVKFNVNTFGLTPADPQIAFPQPVPINGAASYAMPLTFAPQMVAQGQPPNLQLQTAIKNLATGGVFYFTIPINFEALFAASGQIDRGSFIGVWKSIDDSLGESGTHFPFPHTAHSLCRVWVPPTR